MPATIAASPVNFHLSLNVLDIDRSVAFFTTVFGAGPAKRRDDYAKFELANPPLTLSLEPTPPGGSGALNHVGFRLQSVEELVAVQMRLEAAGMPTQREEGVECCYAKQTKFWLHDPDGTLWEIYVLEGDIDRRGSGQEAEKVLGSAAATANGSASEPIRCRSMSIGHDAATTSATANRQRWSHRLGQPLHVPDKFAAASLESVVLQGSFNAPGTIDRMRPFLEQLTDRLRPGAVVSIHCLTSDRPVSEPLDLSGPASVVKETPTLDDLLAALEDAGFEQIALKTYRPTACFTAGAAELRETRVEAVIPKPAVGATVTVVYKGPLAELRLDDGTAIRRGRRTEVPASTVERLRQSPIGESLVVIERAAKPLACV